VANTIRHVGGFKPSQRQMRAFQKPMRTRVQAKSAFRKSSDVLQLDYIAMRNWEVMNSKTVGPPWDFAC